MRPKNSGGKGLGIRFCMRLERFWARLGLGFLDLGHFSVGSFGIFSSDSKNKLLENAGDFRRMGSIRSLFWYLDFWRIFGGYDAGRKSKHQGTKEDQDTKARRICSSSCLGVLVVGLMTAPGRGGIPLEWVTQNGSR